MAIVRRAATPTVASALSIAAASLSSGQSLKFGTISQAVIQAGDGAPITMYGSSGVWDPTRKEARFIGKRNSNGSGYHFLVYAALSDAWSSNRTIYSGGEANQNGHGYDHNAIDSTARHLFRPFGSRTIHVWDSSWGVLPDMPVDGAGTEAGSLTDFPGVGLIYSDRRRIRKFAAGSWTTIASFSDLPNAIHSVSEYNASSNVMIFGAGNVDDAMKMMDASETITDIPTPPFQCGSSEFGGLLAAAGNGFLIWEKDTTNWAYWQPGDLSWASVTQSSGSGASPQTGTPNIAGRHAINIPIAELTVIMYVIAGTTTADVWLHKH